MTKTIALNDRYVLQVDPSKNRVYFTIVGHWKSPADVPNYLEDWRRAIRELSPGFTILSHLVMAKSPPPDVLELHVEAQKLIVESRLSRVAEVVESNADSTKAAVDRISRESGMCKAVFDYWTEAEDWLDKAEPGWSGEESLQSGLEEVAR